MHRETFIAVAAKHQVFKSQFTNKSIIKSKISKSNKNREAKMSNQIFYLIAQLNDE